MLSMVESLVVRADSKFDFLCNTGQLGQLKDIGVIVKPNTSRVSDLHLCDFALNLGIAEHQMFSGNPYCNSSLESSVESSQST